MEMQQPTVAAQDLRHQGELALEPVEVAVGDIRAAGERDVAGAVVTAVPAEGNVHIDRHRFRFGLGELDQGLMVFGWPEGRLPGGDRRVAGVTGPRCVVAGDDVGRDQVRWHEWYLTIKA